MKIQNGYITFVLMLLILSFLFFCSCDDEDSSDETSTTSDDDDNDNDTADDDDDDNDDDNDDDDNETPFPQLDPAVCMSADPVDLQGFDPDYLIVDSGSWVQNKNYYLFTVLSEVADALSIMTGDTDLTAISADRDGRIRQAAIDCIGDVPCYAAALTWSDTEIQETAAALAGGFYAGKDTFNLAAFHLRPSGMFHLHAALSDIELLTNAWEDTIAGMQETFNGYALSIPAGQMDQIVSDVLTDHPDTMLLFEPMMEVTLAALDYHGRDEAGRYEPMETGENQAALAGIDSIDWAQYRFSVILVPGKGPEIEIPLHPTSKLHCELAARRYNAQLAPLIVLSGGHVHPDHTPYCEAIEMKKYLMEELDIPEEAILVDPHARHTTTNLRDVSRLIFRYGIPPDKPALITTNCFQNFYIDFMINGRSLDELGYLPWRKVKWLDLSDSCLLPSPTTLYADPRDPLDP